jgi:chaperonin GroEL
MSTETTITHDKTFDTIKSAVNKMVDFIRPTYGPAGNKIVISKMAYFMVVDDGVQGARDFELKDPSENAIVRLVREVAVRTNDRVGDGTTSSLIVTQGIINEVGRKGKWNGRKISLELQQGAKEAKEQLLKMAKPIKGRAELKKVALVSFDNEKIADMLADLYEKLGKDAVITIDKSPTMETTSEISEGVTLESGYISPYMITNADRMEAVLEKPLILITDYRLTEANDVLPILNKMAAAGKNKLVLIAENVEGHALATMVINHPNVMNPQTQKPGVIQSVALNAPKGDDSKIFLEDLALLTGGKVFSSSKGDKLENAEIKDLGTCDRVIVKRNDTVFVGPKGKRGDIGFAITKLRSAMEAEKEVRAKEDLKKRLARLTNQVAVIRVGAPTENEQKALKYKVEDAVHAVKSAYQSGVVCGAGLSLERLETSSPILNEALKCPARQLRENMDMTDEVELKDGEALNMVTGKKGKFLDVGVVDPVEVLIAGIESAVSISTMLLTSHGMIVEHQKEEKSYPQGQ